MKFSLFRKYGARNSPPIFDAIEDGLRRLGHDIYHHNNEADVAVIWSQLWVGRMRPNQAVFDMYRKSHRPVLVVEVGALKRNETWRLLVNGEHRFLIQQRDQTRASSLDLCARPWRRDGRHVLIALQSPESQQWHGMPDINAWMHDVVQELRAHTDRPIIMRPHPRYHKRAHRMAWPAGCHVQLPNYVAGTYDSFDFDQALNQTWAVVNWNSNPAVISALQGVPVFVGAHSLAAPVGNMALADIESPLMPDRDQWVNDLAWHEWYTDEIKSGQALEPVISAINAARNS